MFSDQVLTVLYSDGFAIMLLIGQVFLTRRKREWETSGTRVYFGICRLFILFSATHALSHALRYHPFPGGTALAMLAKTATELGILLLLFFWFAFEDYLVYQSRDHILRHLKPAFIPILIMAGLFILNMFTGILFTFDEDLVYHPGTLYPVILAVEFLYGMNLCYLLVQYRKKKDSPHFFKLTPFIVPVLIGALMDLFTPFRAFFLGGAVGLTLLHFSFMNLMCYGDWETGFYNKEFIGYLLSYEKQGKYPIRSGILFETRTGIEAFADLLREELPDASDTVYIGEGKFLMLAGIADRSAIRYLLVTIHEAAEEKGLEFSAFDARRKGDESAESFVGRMLEGGR